MAYFIFIFLQMVIIIGIECTFSGNLNRKLQPYEGSRTAESIYAFRRIPQTYAYNSRAYLESRPNQHIVYLRSSAPVYKSDEQTKKKGKNIYQKSVSKSREKIKSHKKKASKSKRNLVSKHSIEFVKNSTLDSNAKDDIATAKKDYVNINGKYYLRSANSDFFPFDGNKRNYLKIREDDIGDDKKTGIRFMKNKRPTLEGVSAKEIVFSSQSSDEHKPIEIFVTENIVPSYHPDISSSSAKSTLSSDIPEAVARSELIDQEVKKKRNHEYLEKPQDGIDNQEELKYQGFQISKHDENSASSLVDTLQKDDQQKHNGFQQPQYFHLSQVSEPNNILFDQKDHGSKEYNNFLHEQNDHADKENDNFLHEQTNQVTKGHNSLELESLLNYKHMNDGNPSTDQHMNEGDPFIDRHLNDENRMHLAPDRGYYKHKEFLPEERDNHDPEKLNENNPSKMMDERSNSVVTDNSLVFSPSVDDHFSMRSRFKSDEDDSNSNQNFDFNHGEDTADQERKNEEEVNHQFPSAITVTKAIMQSAKMIDHPIYNDNHLNSQNFMPDVYEAFSRTNNDLKQRYKVLRKWAAQKIAQHNKNSINEEELKEEVKNLNDLSSMVRLVNNLEKDMLKIILKRKRRLGERMGYKHENIPGSESSKKRFNSPSDVQELLQYIYDTYIENRTADEIPVVLQAFQKSLADIVSKKNVSTKVALQDYSHSSPYLSDSIKTKTNFSKQNQELYEKFTKDDEDQSETNQNTLHQFNSKTNSSSPLVTVKLLKALDLFLDSIEIERKIKHFRAMVEDLANEINGSVLLTSDMRVSLGKINQEINETLIQSEFLNRDQNDTIIDNQNMSVTGVGKFLLSVPNHKNLSLTKIKIFEEMNEIMLPKDSASIPEKKNSVNSFIKIDSKKSENQENNKKNDLTRSEMYDLDSEMNIDDDLTYEKNWYGKNKFTNSQPSSNITNLNLTHIYEPGMLDAGKIVSSEFEAALYNMADTNISAINKEAMKGLTYYATLIEKLHNKSISPSFNSNKLNNKLYSMDNMTNLNKEAMKGHDYYAKLADKLHNEIYNQTKNLTHDLLAKLEHANINISGLNAEAMKAHSFYSNMSHNDSNLDQIYKLYLEAQTMNHRNQEAVQSEWLEILNALNTPTITHTEADNFDMQVQKIIDKAISEAKNLTDAEQNYHKIQNLNISKSLEKTKDNLRNTLESRGVDQGAIKNVDSYLDAENKYIGQLFYGEGERFNSENNFTFISREGSDQYQFFKQPNKTHPSLEQPNKSIVSLEKPNKSTTSLEQSNTNIPLLDKKNIFPNANKKEDITNIVEGQWDKRNMDFHGVKENHPEDLLQIAHLKSLVQKLQEESLKEEAIDDARFAKELILSKIRKKKKKNNYLTHRVIIPKHYQNIENIESSKISSILAHKISEIKRNRKSPSLAATFGGRVIPLQVTGAKRNIDQYKSYSQAQAVLKYNKNTFINKRNSIRNQKQKNDKNNLNKIKRSQIPQIPLKHRHHHNKKSQLKWRRKKHRRSKKNARLKVSHRNKKDIIVHSKLKKLNPKQQVNTTDEEETPSLKDVIIKDSFFSKLSEEQQQLVWEAVKKDWKRQHNHAITKETTNKLNKLTLREDILPGSLASIKEKNTSHFSIRKKQLSRKHSSLKKENFLKKIELSSENLFNKSNLTELNTFKKTDKLLLSDKAHNLTNISLNETNEIIDTLPDSTDNATKRLCQHFLYPNDVNFMKYLCNSISNKSADLKANGSFGVEVTPENASLHFTNNVDLDTENFNNSENVVNQFNHTADFENKTTKNVLDSVEDRKQSNENSNFTSDLGKKETKKPPSDELLNLIRNIQRINETVYNVDNKNKSSLLIKETEDGKYTDPFENNLKYLDRVNNTIQKAVQTKSQDFNNGNSTITTNLSLSEQMHLISLNSQKNITDNTFKIFSSDVNANIGSESSSSPETILDFFNATDKVNVIPDLGDTALVPESDKKCEGDYILFRKGDFEYKIPAFKCSRNKSQSLDVAFWNKTEKVIKEMNEKNKCMPVYKSFVFGNSDYKLQVGCTENPFISEKNKYSKGNLDASETNIKTMSKNSKVLYRVQDSKKHDKTQHTSSVNTTQHENSATTNENDLLNDETNDEILKQAGQLFELKKKNFTSRHFSNKRGSENFLIKSGVHPDYLKTSLNSTSTFKFKDTSITKNIYVNGAKVITMKKEKDTLSIVYPPKNDTNNSGYMVLNENNTTFKIPLYGNKDGSFSNNFNKSKVNSEPDFLTIIQNKNKAELQKSSYKMEAPDSRGLKLHEIHSTLDSTLDLPTDEDNFKESFASSMLPKDRNNYRYHFKNHDGRRFENAHLKLYDESDGKKPYFITKPIQTPVVEQYENFPHIYHEAVNHPMKLGLSPSPYKIQQYISIKPKPISDNHLQDSGDHLQDSGDIRYLTLLRYHKKLREIQKPQESLFNTNPTQLNYNKPNLQTEYAGKQPTQTFSNDPYIHAFNPLKNMVHPASEIINNAIPYQQDEEQINQADNLPASSHNLGNYFEKPTSLITYNNNQRVVPNHDVFSGNYIKNSYLNEGHTQPTNLNLYHQHQEFVNLNSLQKDFSPEYYAKDDENQMKVIKSLQRAADESINLAYMNLQKKLINKYSNGSDRLDSFDEKQLETLGYNPNDLSDINKQVLGKKRMMDNQALATKRIIINPIKTKLLETHSKNKQTENKFKVKLN
ncbi:uncharacterized protein PF3D7_1120600 isoform X2 [Hydra vulgaris]|uniref:uncharacterized protein PF3D7_1120600 isoform X2 n=1 Tax=Hydra vulgaris TaxID=6087 RepID=UPI0032EA3574